MRELMVAALVLVVMAPASWALDEVCLNAAEPKISDFNACAIPKLDAMAKGDQPLTVIIREAMEACSAEVEAVRSFLKVEPCNQTNVQADALVDDWLNQAREDFTDHISKVRE